MHYTIAENGTMTLDGRIGTNRDCTCRSWRTVRIGKKLRID
jgi:hypothetical protein